MQQLASSERTERVQAYQREAEGFRRQTEIRRLQEEEEERRESDAAAAAQERKWEREMFASWERKERVQAFRKEAERQRTERERRHRQEGEEETSDSEASAWTTTTLESETSAMSTTTMDGTMTPEMEEFLRDPIAAARKVGLIPMEEEQQQEAQAMSPALDSPPTMLTTPPASPDDHPDNGVGLDDNWNNVNGESDNYGWLIVHQPGRIAREIEDAMTEEEVEETVNFSNF